MGGGGEGGGGEGGGGVGGGGVGCGAVGGDGRRLARESEPGHSATQPLQPDHLHFTDQGLALDAQWKLHVPLADGGNGDGDGKLWTEHSVQVLQPAHSHFLFHPLGLSRQ